MLDKSKSFPTAIPTKGQSSRGTSGIPSQSFHLLFHIRPWHVGKICIVLFQMRGLTVFVEAWTRPCQQRTCKKDQYIWKWKKISLTSKDGDLHHLSCDILTIIISVKINIMSMLLLVIKPQWGTTSLFDRPSPWKYFLQNNQNRW